MYPDDTREIKMINTRITDEFPIQSQTSENDKHVLLTIREVLKQVSGYNYLEIGSYWGGSLCPFLRDSNCSKILSIDDRERIQPDERGAKYDYVGVTHSGMINKLQSVGLDTSKLEVFDGSINDYPYENELYDFVFIDGEHTDRACFRDFIYAEKMFKQNCIVAFHDADLIYKAIQNIIELLKSRNINFKFIKVKDSSVFCLFLNDYANIDVNVLFSVEQDIEQFYKNSEDVLLLQAARHRVEIINSNYSIRPMPSFKQYE